MLRRKPTSKLRTRPHKATPKKVVRRHLGLKKSATPPPMVLTEEQYDDMSAEAKDAWGGYFYKMTYDVVTPESAEDNDVAESGWEEKKSKAFNSLEELMKYVEDHTWLGWSSSTPDANSWLISEGETNYLTGEETSYDLFVKRVDGKPLCQDELFFIHPWRRR